MAHVPRVFGSAAEIDRAAWDAVWCACGRPTFLDLRFVAAVEAALGASCRFWYVLVHDDGGRPVACAGLTAMTVPLAEVGDPRLTWIVDHGPRFLARLLSPNLLFCSLPGSPADRSLAIARGADGAAVLAELDRLTVRLAAEAGADAVVFKEFAPADLAWMDPLERRGYRRLEVPPMHLIDPRFDDFEQFCAALRKKYRRSVKRSTYKLAGSGIVPTVLTDPADMLRLYTPQAHELYCEVVRRSDVKVEMLPIAYFHEIAARLEGKVELVALIRDGRLLSFAWCLCDHEVYHMMYGGFDYELNHEYDLYFNLVYANLDRAFRKRVSTIHVGQMATDFKSRLGCRSEPRYVYAKGTGFLMTQLIRWGANLLVARKPAKPPAHIFKGRQQTPPRPAGDEPDRSA